MTKPAFKPTVTVIIPTLNGEKYLKTCLDSVFAQTYGNFDVVIFDNGSTDGTLKIAENYPVEIVKNEKNLGWAKANNLCIKRAKTKYVFLLNVDTILDADCLRKLYEFSESKDDLACVSPRIIEYRDFLDLKYGKGYPMAFDVKEGLIKAYCTDEKSVEVSFVPGTALFGNLENLQDKLRFREDFFMYHEDVELSLRILAETELKLYFLNPAVVGHDSKQSFSKTSTCKLAIRNLFVCLVTYQKKKEFLSNCRNYGRNLFSTYKRFYRHYYPFAYPVFGLIFFTVSMLKSSRWNGFDLRRLNEINGKMDKLQKQFEFIF
jgi:GT2 family glycosyltransferase